jgi:hypothetical protein
MHVAPFSTYIGHFFSGDVDPTAPHAVLIAAAVIGGLLVGIGIIWEAARDGHLWTLPTACVLIGVIVEAGATVVLFEFDEGITHAQQAQIIALLPRELGTTSRAKIASCNGLAHAPVQIQSLYADSEGYRLGSEIMKALERGNIAVDDKRGQAELDLTRPQPFGLYIEGPESEVPFVLCLTAAIRETKELSGTVAKQIPDKYPLAVYVGLKQVD